MQAILLGNLWCPQQDLNLFSHFAAAHDSEYRSINTMRNACLQKPTFANFYAQMKFSCQ